MILQNPPRSWCTPRPSLWSRLGTYRWICSDNRIESRIDHNLMGHLRELDDGVDGRAERQVADDGRRHPQVKVAPVEADQWHHRVGTHGGQQIILGAEWVQNLIWRKKNNQKSMKKCLVGFYSNNLRRRKKQYFIDGKTKQVLVPSPTWFTVFAHGTTWSCPF